MSKPKLTGEVVKKYLTRFKKTPSLTLARKIYNENRNDKLFMSIDHIRGIIRYYRGSSGDNHRKYKQF
jgi:hypothetical protein